MIKRDAHCIAFDPKYSDDINFIRSWYPKISQAKRLIPKMLIVKGLMVNTSKTEEFEIFRNNEQRRKDWKVLKSLLDTDDDVKGRHSLAGST